ncbi:MAG TPA: YncE family protein, partial [Bryobacteraceae bacterium]|nr:YncE family protein [Bryobacteraceae bacterium]
MRHLVLCLAVGCCAFAETLIIGHKWADSVGYYDGESGKLLASVPVGLRPHEMATSADRKLVFVTNYGVNTWTQTETGTNTVSVIDRQSRKEVGRIDLGDHHRPHGIERGSTSGLLYITADFPPSLLVVDAQKRAVVKRFDIGQKAPHMLAISHDEKHAWVANSGSGSVTRITLDGSVPPKHIEVGGVPMGIALEEQKRRYCWVVNRTANELVAIDMKTASVAQRVSVPGQPVRLVLTPGDNAIIVSLIGSGEAAVIDAESFRELKRFNVGANAEGLHFDAPSGFLYVSAQG